MKDKIPLITVLYVLTLTISALGVTTCQSLPRPRPRQFACTAGFHQEPVSRPDAPSGTAFTAAAAAAAAAVPAGGRRQQTPLEMGRRPDAPRAGSACGMYDVTVTSHDSGSSAGREMVGA